MNFVPSLTRNQWLWLGGAAVLGVTEVVSAPIAVALAALPVLDSLASSETSNGRSSSNGTGRSTSGRTTRRRSSSNGRTRRTSSRTRRASTA